MRVFDTTLDTLERALDVRLLRHNALAGNLANANTPGFVPRDVDFGAAMRDAGSAAPEGSPETPPVPRVGITLVSAGHGLGTGGAEIPLEAAGPTEPSSTATAGGPGSPAIAVRGAAAGLDGNAVDVDRALAAVAENAIQYNAAARAAGKKLAIIRYAASDGAA